MTNYEEYLSFVQTLAFSLRADLKSIVDNIVITSIAFERFLNSDNKYLSASKYTHADVVIYCYYISRLKLKQETSLKLVVEFDRLSRELLYEGMSISLGIKKTIAEEMVKDRFQIYADVFGDNEEEIDTVNFVTTQIIYKDIYEDYQRCTSYTPYTIIGAPDAIEAEMILSNIGNTIIDAVDKIIYDWKWRR